MVRSISNQFIHYLFMDSVGPPSPLGADRDGLGCLATGKAQRTQHSTRARGITDAERNDEIPLRLQDLLPLGLWAIVIFQIGSKMFMG